MILSHIVAFDKNGAIGKGNTLPWKIKSDMAWFKRHTSNKPVLLGRKTFESIGRPLPNRVNIILTRDSATFYGKYPDLVANSQVMVVTSVDAAIELAAVGLEAPELMVCGGAEIYHLTGEIGSEDNHHVTQTKLYISIVDTFVEGADAFYLPEYIKDILLIADYEGPVETSDISDDNEFSVKYYIFD